MEESQKRVEEIFEKIKQAGDARIRWDGNSALEYHAPDGNIISLTVPRYIGEILDGILGDVADLVQLYYIQRYLSLHFIQDIKVKEKYDRLVSERFNKLPEPTLGRQEK